MVINFIDFLSDSSNKKLLYMFKIELKGEKTFFFLNLAKLRIEYEEIKTTQTNTNIIEVLKRNLEVHGHGAQ